MISKVISDIKKETGRPAPTRITTIKAYWSEKGNKRETASYCVDRNHYLDCLRDIEAEIPEIPIGRVDIGYGILSRILERKEYESAVQVIKPEYWSKTSGYGKRRIVKADLGGFTAYARQEYVDVYGWTSQGAIFIDVKGVVLHTEQQCLSGNPRLYIVEASQRWRDDYRLFKLPVLDYPIDMKEFLGWVKDKGKGFADVPKSGMQLWDKKGRGTWKEDLKTEQEFTNYLDKVRAERKFEKMYHLPQALSIDYARMFYPVSITQKDVEDYLEEYRIKKLWEIKY